MSDAGIVSAGTGLGEGSARQAAYLATSNGDIALVATASTFPPSAQAGPATNTADGLSKPRPGMSALHVREVRVVTPEQLVQLSALAGPFATREGSGLRVSDQLFAPGPAPGAQWEVDPKDEAVVLKAVQEAKVRASLVLFAIHAHETAGDIDLEPPQAFEPMVIHKANEAPSPNDPQPAAFETELFHKVVQQGADVVLRTGPHVLSGIEIYRGHPIFYGLGSLFLDFGGDRVLYTPEGDKITVPDGSVS